ncbi:MAG: SAM-dependent methyltransferase, partial [Cyanobacteriota bacterium]
MLQPRLTRDGSFSLYSSRFGEGFHSRGGALGEARGKFVVPASLHRFGPGRELRVVEVCVGTGTNTAALLEACRDRKLRLDWWGLELDREPWQLARSSEAFRSQWSEAVRHELTQLLEGPR